MLSGLRFDRNHVTALCHDQRGRRHTSAPSTRVARLEALHRSNQIPLVLQPKDPKMYTWHSPRCGCSYLSAFELSGTTRSLRPRAGRRGRCAHNLLVCVHIVCMYVCIYIYIYIYIYILYTHARSSKPESVKRSVSLTKPKALKALNPKPCIKVFRKPFK